jgi:DNA-binding MarR family transcriptional regulator
MSAKPIDGQQDREGKSAAADLEDVALDSLRLSLGYLLRRLQLSYKKHFTKRASPKGVQASQVGAMFTIGFNPGIAPSQLGAALGIDAAQVTSILNQLELKRFISRRSSKVDGRSRAVSLTAAGQREFLALQKMVAEAEATFIGNTLTEDETRLLFSLLARVLDGQPE